MSVRVAYAKNAALDEAVATCAAALHDCRPLLLLMFCGGKHDPLAVMTAMRQHFGDVAVAGGSAAGAIARTGSGYSGFEMVVAAFDDPLTCPALVVEGGLLAGEREAGRALGERVARESVDGSTVLLLFDSVANCSPLRLHPASTIVEGFHDGLSERRVVLIGGGLLTDMNLSDGWVFDGTQACKHAVLALVFPPGVRASSVVLHGCRPVSMFMEITRIEGAEVYELDGRPALTVIEEMLGLPLGGTSGQDLSLIATLGQKQGDPFAEYNENLYVNRLILAANRATQSITLFEPDFSVGTQIQIMSRDNDLMLKSVREGVGSLNAAVGDKARLLALYIDCAGRASARSGAAEEEAQLVVDGLIEGMPLLGFYSGVEIAPFSEYSRPLDWTGVLTVLHG